MAAQWISDGSEIPAVPLKTPRPCRSWQFGRFELAQAPRHGRWSCQTAGEPVIREDGLVMAGTLPAVGAAGYRTPFGAFLAVLRAARRAA